jgi:hypothetical protein
MGVLADLFANAKTIDFSATREGKHRSVVRDLQALRDKIGDPSYPSGFAATNQVDHIAADGGSPSGGNFTLTFTLNRLQPFTTANIAYNANAGTIQTAINTAAALAGVPGFVNGDIAVTGGPLSTTACDFTYSGTSVAAKKHTTVSINGAGITGGTAGAASTTTNGQTNRTAWATLNAAGITSGTPPVQGVATAPTVTSTYNTNAPEFDLEQDTLRALANEAAADDGNAAVATAINTALKV